jgi:hypothetical protein
LKNNMNGIWKSQKFKNNPKNTQNKKLKKKSKKSYGNT